MRERRRLCVLRERGRRVHRRRVTPTREGGAVLTARPPAHKLNGDYTLRRPVMGEVLSTRIWGVPLAGGPLL